MNVLTWLAMWYTVLCGLLVMSLRVARWFGWLRDWTPHHTISWREFWVGWRWDAESSVFHMMVFPCLGWRVEVERSKPSGHEESMGSSLERQESSARLSDGAGERAKEVGASLRDACVTEVGRSMYSIEPSSPPSGPHVDKDSRVWLQRRHFMATTLHKLPFLETAGLCVMQCDDGRNRLFFHTTSLEPEDRFIPLHAPFQGIVFMDAEGTTVGRMEGNWMEETGAPGAVPGDVKVCSSSWSEGRVATVTGVVMVRPFGNPPRPCLALRFEDGVAGFVPLIDPDNTLTFFDANGTRLGDLKAKVRKVAEATS